MKSHLFELCCFVLLLTVCYSEAMAADRPNIVVIMADDIGLGDIGWHHRRHTGQEPLAPTPAIDELAESGMWFTAAHSPTALCWPSRYAFMCGNYNYRCYAPWGVWRSFRETPFQPSDATLGTVTKQAGYATGFVGKWHLGGDFHGKNGTQFYRGNDRGEKPIGVDAKKWVGAGPQDWGFE